VPDAATRSAVAIQNRGVNHAPSVQYSETSRTNSIQPE
jgi:hypothetical protein